MVAEKIQNRAKSPMTKAIMTEIKSRNSNKDNFNNHNDHNKLQYSDNYVGVKFHLSKSDSGNSRLELIGTETVDIQNDNPQVVEKQNKEINTNKLINSKWDKAKSQKIFYCISPSNNIKMLNSQD